ncbi:MAG: glutamyl-tRNA reductase [Oscillospiraceae bacterium]|nr:glutamyl-tRNA reductase [Oscillospiraceae bacterium]
MYLFSIHYRNAPVEIRSRFAFSEAERRALKAALSEQNIPLRVILCTCNRTELYFSGDEIPTAAILPVLAAFSGMPQDGLSDFLRMYCGDAALRHLFRTACGADSMILGEDEILRQVKEAYAEAAEQEQLDFETNAVFQAAIACAKRIKTDTALSSTPVSAATIAANEAANFAEQVHVLMIGASGQIGSAVLKNLLAHKNVSVTVTQRTKGHISLLPEAVRCIPYADRYAHADRADCIISATASPHFTVTAKQLAGALHTQKPRLLIDLAVPQDIEPAAAALDGIRYLSIDDFEQLAQENRSLRESIAVQAEHIIAEETDELKKKLIYRELLPEMPQISRYLSQHDPLLLIYKMKADADSRSFAQLAEVLRRIAREA